MVALGSEAVPAARLYGHLTGRRLTGRRLVVADDRDAWPDLEGPDLDPPSVLVTLWNRLTPELLDRLYGREGTAPGIIAAPDVAALHRQVLVRSAARRLGSGMPPVASDIFPLADFSVLYDGATTLFGGSASRRVKQLAITHGADLLTIMTHSDGVDAYLGPDLTLCARRHEDSAALGGPLPLCALSGQCHRHRRPVAEVMRSDRVVAPEDVAAHILLFDTRFGVMPQGSLVDPRYGLGTRLASSARIGAMLAPWRIVLSSPEHARRLERDILDGVALGAAVARFNAHPVSRDRQYRMCLFGDPDLRLQPAKPAPAAASTVLAPVATPARPARKTRRAELFHLCISEAARTAIGTPLEAVALKASAVAAAAAAEPASGGAAGKSDTLAPLREAMLDYALARGKLSECWMPFVERYADGGRIGCPACGRPSDVRFCRMPRYWRATRRMVLCPICGIVEDAPLQSDLTMTLAAGRVSLDGMPGAGWCAGLALSASDPSLSVALRWPAGSDGRPVPNLAVPLEIPPGPLRVSVFVLWGTEFAVLSRLARGIVDGNDRNGAASAISLEPAATPGGRALD